MVFGSLLRATSALQLLRNMGVKRSHIADAGISSPAQTH